MLYISLVPRRSRGGGNAWYTLFAHAFNFRDFSENRILSVIYCVTLTYRPTPTKLLRVYVVYMLCTQYFIFFGSWRTVKASSSLFFL